METINGIPEIVKEALSAVGAGARDYDPPEVNFNRVALMWTAYLQANGIDVFIDKGDVAFMMVLFKIAREIGGTKTDNYVDMIGYILCADMMRQG